MKKLIAISITLALVASAAFAQVTLSGNMGSKWVVFQDKPNDGEDTLTSLIWWGSLSLNGQTEDGKLGGSLRVVDRDWSNGGIPALDVTNWAYVWWQPIDMLKIQLGRHGDGFYPDEAFVGWNLNTGANDFVAYDGGKQDAFAGGGLFKQGASFVITPLDGLKVVFGLPVFAKGSVFKEDLTGNAVDFNAMNVWKHFFLQAGYTLDNLGVITLTYKSGTQDWRDNMPTDLNNPELANADVGKIYAAFQLTMIENLGLHFGVNYNLPAQKEYVQGGKTLDGKVNSPVAIGLGADYTAGDFGVKAVLQFKFLGSVDDGDDHVTPTPFNFYIAVMPYYDLGILKAYLGLGLDLVTDTENANGDNIRSMYLKNWYVNPYVVKNVGAGSFYAGFQLYGNGVQKTGSKDSESKIGWAVPVGLKYAF